MRAVIQRVSEASISTRSGHKDSLGEGIVIFLGIEEGDNEEDIRWLSKKIINLRIFNDLNGVMNLSLREIDGEVLIVSQFTLHASTKKGNRPSYIRSAGPEKAIPFYERFIGEMESELGKSCSTGIFGDHMSVSLVNNGPVTIIIDTKNKE